MPPPSPTLSETLRLLKQRRINYDCSESFTKLEQLNASQPQQLECSARRSSRVISKLAGRRCLHIRHPCMHASRDNTSARPSAPTNRPRQTQLSVYDWQWQGYLAHGYPFAQQFTLTFFQDICKPTSCLHHLIPPARDTSVTTRLTHHFFAIQGPIYARKSTVHS